MVKRKDSPEDGTSTNPSAAERPSKGPGTAINCKDFESLTIKGIGFENFGTAVRFDQVSHATVEDVRAVKTDKFVEATGCERLFIRRSEHHVDDPAESKAEAAPSPRKYYGGYSFGKGDHLPDD